MVAKILLTTVMLSAALTASTVWAESVKGEMRSSAQENRMAAPADQPVLILRFNKPNVRYKPAVQQTVAAVNQVKPEARYAVLSIIPENKEQPKEVRRIAEYNAGKVAEALQNNGVSSSNITISYQESSHVSMNEVHVFAQ